MTHRILSAAVGNLRGKFRELLSIKERTKAEIRRKIGRILFFEGNYLVLSAEEFILRMHQDEYDRNRIRRRDVFALRNTFCQLSGAHRNTAAFDSALNRLAEAGIIELGKTSDGQAWFQISDIADPKNFHNTLRDLRETLDVGVAFGVGQFRELASWYLPSEGEKK